MQAQDNQFYYAESRLVPRSTLKSYLHHYQTHIQPQRQQQVQQGLIRSHELYTLRITAEKEGDFPTWNVLELIGVEHAEQAQALQQHTSASMDALVTVVRQELLVSTPASHFPYPPEHVHKRKLKPFFAVEYVDVQQPYLDEFRDIMITNNGPAMNYILEHKRWCYCMIALETVNVYMQHPDAPNWNQIHVIGLYPEAMLKYKNDFGEGLKPAGISFADNFHRLEQIRTMRYKTLGKRYNSLKYM